MKANHSMENPTWSELMAKHDEEVRVAGSKGYQSGFKDGLEAGRAEVYRKHRVQGAIAGAGFGILIAVAAGAMYLTPRFCL